MNLSWGRIFFSFFICLMLSTTAFAESFSIKSLSIDSTQKNLLIQGTNPNYQNIKLSRHVLSSPLRVIYDIYDAKLLNPKNSAVLNNPNVTEVRVAQFSTAPYVVRIVFYCKDDESAKRITPTVKSNSISFNLGSEKDNYDHSFFIFKEDQTSPDIQSNVDYTAFYTNLNVIVDDGKKKTEASKPQNLHVAKPSAAPEPGWIQIPISEEFLARYTIMDIETIQDKIVIKGKGIISVASPFVLSAPNRFVVDMPFSRVQKPDLNKTITLSNGDKVRLGAFDAQTARAVVETSNFGSYNAIISPNAETLTIQKSNIVNAPVSNLTEVQSINQNNYSSKLILKFDKAIHHSISKTKDEIKLKFYNLATPNEQILANFDQTKQFRKITATPIEGTKNGQIFSIPINPSAKATIELKPDGKELTIFLKENVQKQGTVIIKKGTTVVIDAGHGGSDYGAIRDDVNEKDLTLELSQKLRDYLQKYGVKVIMTRDKDETLSLQRRSEISNEINPNAFVSVHINSFTRSDVKGLETYWYQPQSKALGQIVHNYLTLSIDSPDRGLQTARFYVINHTNAPSILVEVGYISNPDERKEMQTSKRQKKTVKAIGDGILLYLGMMYEQQSK